MPIVERKCENCFFFDKEEVVKGPDYKIYLLTCGNGHDITHTTLEEGCVDFFPGFNAAKEYIISAVINRIYGNR